MTYQYDGEHRVTQRIDAKRQKTLYTYDIYGRLTQKRYFAWVNQILTEQPAQEVDYYYDTNPLNGSYSAQAWGRLAAVTFAAGYSYQYSYNQAGRVIKQKLRTPDQRSQQPVEFEAQYGWDNQGRMTSQSYPAQDYLTAGPQYAYQFDAMGRTNLMTTGPFNQTVASAAYGPAGELTSLNGDTRTYNMLGQLTRISGGGIDLEYVYTAGQNNGRITQQIDHISGEQVTYQYDQLNRLSHAETLDNSWGLTYRYDGFGNLTAKTVTKGTAIPGWTGFTVAYDPATNHGNAYDANGNASVGGVYPYDVENRLTATIRSPAKGEYYGSDGSYVYDPWGKRVGWRFPRSTGIVGADPETKCEVHFYGTTGQKLASYSCGYHDAEGGDGTFYWSLKGYNVYFAGRLVQSSGVSVTTDRLGSVRANGSGERFNYLPHGEERTPTADGREKFATYIRDSGGVDYADQRYYDRGSGRFLTADPSTGSSPFDPGSWNKYAYVGGDPVNFADPSGLNRLMCDVYTDYGCAGATTSTGGGALTNWYNNGEGWSIGGVVFLPGDPVGGGDPTGGGGGRGSYLTYKIPNNLLAVNPANSITLNRTISALETNLDEDCLGWLTTAPIAPDAAHLYSWMEAERSQVGIATFKDAATGKDVSTPIGAAELGIAGFNILINTNSMAFQGSGASGFGNLNQGTDALRAFTLLHEFAHQLGVPGFLPEAGADAATLQKREAENNAQIFSHCSKTLGRFSN